MGAYEMTDAEANVIFVLIYLFGFVPLIGAIFGGNYASYGHNDNYENCMGRGFKVHFVALCLVLVFQAIATKF
jgi:hypothetical protein